MSSYRQFKTIKVSLTQKSYCLKGAKFWKVFLCSSHLQKKSMNVLSINFFLMNSDVVHLFEDEMKISFEIQPPLKVKVKIKVFCNGMLRHGIPSLGFDLKVSKAFFLETPLHKKRKKYQTKFCTIKVDEARAEFCLIFHLFFGRWSFKKKCF